MLLGPASLPISTIADPDRTAPQEPDSHVYASSSIKACRYNFASARAKETNLLVLNCSYDHASIQESIE